MNYNITRKSFIGTLTGLLSIPMIGKSTKLDFIEPGTKENASKVMGRVSAL